MDIPSSAIINIMQYLAFLAGDVNATGFKLDYIYSYISNNLL